MVPDVFHRDFTPTPYWWEAYTPTAGDLVDVPKTACVAIVGGGYAGLSTALELAKHGIDAVVLEANELGFGASTRNGGAVSGGVNIGKSFTGRSADVEPERAERLLSDASDAYGLIDRLIEEEKIDCFWEKPGRFVGAWTKKHFDAQSRRLATLNSAARLAPTWCRSGGSAKKSRATIISAAWSSSGPANFTRHSITRGCSRPAAGAVFLSAPTLRSRASAGPAPDGMSKPAAERFPPAMW